MLNEEGISKLRYTMLGSHGGQIEQSEKEGERERKRKRVNANFAGWFLNLSHHFVKCLTTSAHKTMSLEEFEPGCILN